MVTDILQFAQIMGRNQYGRPALCNLGHQDRPDLFPHNRIKAIQRFIQNQKFRSATECQPECNLFCIPLDSLRILRFISIPGKTPAGDKTSFRQKTRTFPGNNASFPVYPPVKIKRLIRYISHLSLYLLFSYTGAPSIKFLRHPAGIHLSDDGSGLISRHHLVPQAHICSRRHMHIYPVERTEIPKFLYQIIYFNQSLCFLLPVSTYVLSIPLSLPTYSAV